MCTTVVIKDVDQKAFRKLKAEAIKLGMKIGEAASEAFRLWTESRGRQKVRDTAQLRLAAQIIDENRSKLVPTKNWSSVQEIRKWREL